MSYHITRKPDAVQFALDLYPWCIRAIGSAMVASAIVAASVTTLTSCMRMQTPRVPAIERAAK